MLCLLNTEDFDEDFIDEIRCAESKLFITRKRGKGNNPSVFGRVLLGYMLKKYYGTEGFSYRYGKNGKPYLKDSPLFFSISHSGSAVICCIYENEVGADIEKVKDYNPKIAKRFFTEKEFKLLDESDSKERLFTLLWTLKESILKKDGTGITGGLDTYCFADYASEGEFFAYGCNFMTASYGEYALSVCGVKNALQIVTVTKEDISEYIKYLNSKRT